MYFILKVSLDYKGNYTNLDIVGHTFSTISTAVFSKRINAVEIVLNV